VFLFDDDRYGHGYISWGEVKGMAKHWVKPLKDNADEQTRMVCVQDISIEICEYAIGSWLQYVL
jgi:hypothetical protein